MSYTEQVYRKADWWGALPVGVPLSVGDIVQYKDKRLLRGESITDLVSRKGIEGVEFPAAAVAPVTGPQVYHHGGSRSFKANADAGVDNELLSVTGQIGVTFSESNGFWLEYEQARIEQYENIPAATEQMVRVANHGLVDWQGHWALVVAVVRAKKVIVARASEKESSVMFGFKADSPVGAEIGLVAPNVEYSAVADASGGAAMMIEAEDDASLLSPLFHCVRIKRRWLIGPRTGETGLSKIHDHFPAHDIETTEAPSVGAFLEEEIVSGLPLNSSEFDGNFPVVVAQAPRQPDQTIDIDIDITGLLGEAALPVKFDQTDLNG